MLSLSCVLWKKLITHPLGPIKLIIIPLFLPSYVGHGEAKINRQTTTPFLAVMVKFAPEMTAASMADVLVHHSGAFHVNIATMTNVGREMDIVRSMGIATLMGIRAPLNARFLPNIRINNLVCFKLIYE